MYQTLWAASLLVRGLIGVVIHMYILRKRQPFWETSLLLSDAATREDSLQRSSLHPYKTAIISFLSSKTQTSLKLDCKVSPLPPATFHVSEWRSHFLALFLSTESAIPVPHRNIRSSKYPHRSAKFGRRCSTRTGRWLDIGTTSSRHVRGRTTRPDVWSKQGTVHLLSML